MLMAQPVLERMAVEFQQLKQQREADHQLVVEMLSKLHAAREGKDVLALSRASPKYPRSPRNIAARQSRQNRMRCSFVQA